MDGWKRPRTGMTHGGLLCIHKVTITWSVECAIMSIRRLLPYRPDMEAQDMTRSTRNSHRVRAGGKCSRATTTTDVLDLVASGIDNDADVHEYAYDVQESMGRLLEACVMGKRDGKLDDEYTDTLVRQYVTFVTGNEISLGGSRIEYCADHCVDAIQDVCLTLKDDGSGEDIIKGLTDGIDKNALFPTREIESLRESGVIE